MRVAADLDERAWRGVIRSAASRSSDDHAMTTLLGTAGCHPSRVQAGPTGRYARVSGHEDTNTTDRAYVLLSLSGSGARSTVDMVGGTTCADTMAGSDPPRSPDCLSPFGVWVVRLSPLFAGPRSPGSMAPWFSHPSSPRSELGSRGEVEAPSSPSWVPATTDGTTS